ncbi:MAG: hypothetical protein U9N46_01475 [Euryarchaeota archaeon]|nr:hypothetical protein [Euryarchaeota archaeon]
MRDISGIQGIYRYRHGIMISDMPDCGWSLAPILMWGGAWGRSGLRGIVPVGGGGGSCTILL